MEQRFLPILFLLSVVALNSKGFAEDNWPRFRGPGSCGIADEAAPPDRWSSTENVVWTNEIAVDGKTGRELWRTVREQGALMSNSGWSTPFIWKNELRTEIVAIGKGLTVSYDLEGKELWRLSGLSGQATPTPLAGPGMLYVGTGSQGESNRSLFAVRPGATGDISLKEDEKSNDFVVWYHPRASAYIPSPLFYKERLYVVRDNGILSVFDAKTGERLYRARVGGGGHTFASSPWAFDGKIFFMSEDGDTFVAKPGDAYEEVGKNSLGEMSLAGPAVSGDSLSIRTLTKLYRISSSQTLSNGASQ
jgi:outer membrane protein assembly factor BamB